MVNGAASIETAEFSHLRQTGTVAASYGAFHTHIPPMRDGLASYTGLALTRPLIPKKISAASPVGT